MVSLKKTIQQKKQLTTTITKKRQSEAFKRLQKMLLEFELSYHLSPELSKSQRKKLLEIFENIVDKNDLMV